MYSVVLAAVGALAIGAVVTSQTAAPKPAAMSDTAQRPSPDEAFYREMAMNSLAQIAYGRLAVANASRDEVKRFGQRMIDDHTRSNAGLQPPRPQLRSIVPTELDEKHRAMQRSLEKVKGEQFDRLYLQHMMQMHAQAIDRLQQDARTAKSAEARGWANMTLPMLQEHLKVATAISAGLATSPAK